VVSPVKPEFNLSISIQGDYIGAVQAKVTSENISKVLYLLMRRKRERAAPETAVFLCCGNIKGYHKTIQKTEPDLCKFFRLCCYPAQ
jgi:hypothetical protein